MYRNLQDFLNALRAAGEIKTVSQKVSPEIEISRYTDRESKSFQGGKALFFENVEGSEFPVATNIFGSSRRICMALGVANLDQLGERVRKYMEFDPPKNLRQVLNAIPMAVDLARFFPRKFRGGTPPCQEVVHKGKDADLSRLPVLKCWPKDAGPFVTLPLVITRSLVTGKRNMGMYRLQVFDRNTTGMHWHVHKDGSHYYREYAQAKKRMPVSVAIGADPATTYAATAPMPRGMDEIVLSGFIRKKPVPMAKCVTNDLEVPAEAEFVLEGYVDPGELRMEGPFGDHTGYYSLADEYPVFHVTAITHRKKPVYSATLVGRPPMEDCYLAKATERLFLPMLRSVMPEIRDYWFPWEGVFHNIVVASLEKEYPGHAQKLMSGLWGQGQMSFCKAIVVVDENVDPSDAGSVIDALVERFDPAEDITVAKGILDVLDHSAPSANFGHKIGLDLTRRFPGEPPRKMAAFEDRIPSDDVIAKATADLRPDFASHRVLFAKVRENSREGNRFLALATEKTSALGGRDIAEALLESENLRSFNFFVLYDGDIDLRDDSLVLWKLFNNADPKRDMVRKDGRVVVDACKKGPVDGHDREWPEDLAFDVD